MSVELPSRPRISLPGFGQPLTQLAEWSAEKNKERFPHAIADYYASFGISLRERRMLEFINQITDKPNWSQKVFNDEIVAKWKAEAVRRDEDLDDWWLSEKMFEHCIKELKEKVPLFQEKGFVDVLDAEATVVKGDGVVSEDLRNKLKAAVEPLENVPDRLKDWHPGSDEKVLDLLHPSLFPVVFGRSRALPNGLVPLAECLTHIGKGETIPEFTATNYQRLSSWSNTREVQNAWGSFQWLPSNIVFTESGTPRLTSYINNLHPNKNAELYSVLEQFVDAAIPLWNECLSWYQRRIRILIESTSDEDFVFPEGVKFPREQYIRRHLEVEERDALDQDEMEEAMEMEDRYFAMMFDCQQEYGDFFEQHRILDHHEPEYKPQVETHNLPGARPIDLRKDFADRGLQIIFKLANIHLTPEDPTYDGGSWHVEGSLNEHIVSTCLFYYDSENTTESRLAFRQSFDTEAMTMKNAQWEYASTELFFGVKQEGTIDLNLGSVVTRQDRLLAFPNVLQHQVQPFELADKTKPGHRKILAMFLVDPHIPILSTANVPPQRRDWWAEEVRKVAPFDGLPEELFELIVGGVEDFPISWDDGLAIRLGLMEERKFVDEQMDEELQDTFYFCEH